MNDTNINWRHRKLNADEIELFEALGYKIVHDTLHLAYDYGTKEMGDKGKSIHLFLLYHTNTS